MFKSTLLNTILAVAGLGGMPRIIDDSPRPVLAKPVPANKTRSRISGKVHTSGNKLARKAVEGKLGLRNTTDGGFGENLRRKMNRDNGPRGRV